MSKSLWGLASVVSGMEIPVVLIDGGSGAGKSTFARELARQAPSDTCVISMDDFYPGWSGLAEGSQIVARDVLRIDDPGYWRWDWQHQRRAAWVPVDPSVPLIIEGCGAITPATLACATFSIWLELDAPTRKRRAIGRDGDAFAPHWDEWAAQEAAHWQAHRPWELADVIVRASAEAQVDH